MKLYDIDNYTFNPRKITFGINAKKILNSNGCVSFLSVQVYFLFVAKRKFSSLRMYSLNKNEDQRVDSKIVNGEHLLVFQ